jgi:hypothetical protein
MSAGEKKHFTTEETDISKLRFSPVSVQRALSGQTVLCKSNLKNRKEKDNENHR